jgi:uncharacterized membrane protein
VFTGSPLKKIGGLAFYDDTTLNVIYLPNRIDFDGGVLELLGVDDGDGGCQWDVINDRCSYISASYIDADNLAHDVNKEIRFFGGRVWIGNDSVGMERENGGTVVLKGGLIELSLGSSFISINPDGSIIASNGTDTNQLIPPRQGE